MRVGRELLPLFLARRNAAVVGNLRRASVPESRIAQRFADLEQLHALAERFLLHRLRLATRAS